MNKIIKFVFLVLIILIGLRVVYNIEVLGQQGNLLWEIGRATKDVFVDWWAGFSSK